MGRLAGVSIAAQKRQTWKARVQARRERMAYWGESATSPIAHPPAARRQLALLWYVTVQSGGELRIGWRGDPPLTDDMRALIRKKQLILTRSGRGANIVAPPRSNWIGITATGAVVLGRARISDADKHYIDMAMKTGVVR